MSDRTDAVKIENDGSPHTKVTINGVDISHVTASLHLRQEAGRHPRLELELCLPPNFEGGAEVVIPSGVRAAFIALGWTAPA